ncbi:hypothetical protein ABZS65_19665, partial [Micromonospora sp. NPDC005313]
MTPQRVPLLAGLVVLFAAACTATGHDGASPAPTPTVAAASEPALTDAPEVTPTPPVPTDAASAAGS